MAQAGGLMIIGANPTLELDSLYLVKIDQVRYRAPVFPGHMLELHVRGGSVTGFGLSSSKRNAWLKARSFQKQH